MHPLCSRHSLLKFTLGHDVTLSETLLELAACRCKYKIQANKDLTQPNDDGHARWRVVVMTHACARENDNTVYISERSQTQSRSTSTRCAHRCSAHMRELVCKLEEDVFRRKEKNPDAVPIYRIEELATFGRNGLKYVFDKSPVLCVSLILDFGDLKICQQFSKKP